MPYKTPDDERAFQRAYYDKHKQRLNERRADNRRQHGRSPEAPTDHRGRYRQRKIATLRALGGRCVRCANDDPRVLQFDHINNDGYLDKRKGYRTPYYRAAQLLRAEGLDAAKAVFQLLCANCHMIKTSEARLETGS